MPRWILSCYLLYLIQKLRLENFQFCLWRVDSRTNLSRLAEISAFLCKAAFEALVEGNMNIPSLPSPSGLPYQVAVAECQCALDRLCWSWPETSNSPSTTTQKNPIPSTLIVRGSAPQRTLSGSGDGKPKKMRENGGKQTLCRHPSSQRK